jgi:3',5'-cyclic-AMP phosphodiesterase
MRIIQITDIHVDKVGELTNDINTQVNFLLVLDKAMQYRPEMVVLTGDLCHQDGVNEIYDWFRSRMDILNIPYFVIPGNHDDSVKMANVFGYKAIENELYYKYEKDGFKFLFLDSGKAVMSDGQYRWVEKELSENAVVFMHHPPCKSGVPHMDIHWKFNEIDRFQALVKQKLAVFCGHCHTERTIQTGSMTVFITPSCFLQLGDKSELFEVDHYKPAFRVIDVEWNGEIITTVKYLLDV